MRKGWKSAAVMALFGASAACNPIGANYQGNYVSSEGYRLEITGSEVRLSGLEKLGMGAQEASGGESGYDSVSSALKSGETGIFAFPAIVSAYGVQIRSLFELPRLSDSAEQLIGINLSQTQSDIYVVTENGLKFQNDPEFGGFVKLWEGPATVLAFRTDSSASQPVEALDAELAVQADVSVSEINMPMVGNYGGNQIGFNTHEHGIRKIRFQRVP